MNFNISFNECPYATDSFRAKIRDMLNEIESKKKGIKLNIVTNFLKLLPNLKEEQKITVIASCKICEEATSGEVCSACLFERKIIQINQINKLSKINTIKSRA